MTLEKKSQTVTLSLSASGTALLTSAIGQQLRIPSPQFAFEAANQIVVGEAGCDACVLNGDAWGEETCALFIALHDMPRVGINSDAVKIHCPPQCGKIHRSESSSGGPHYGGNQG
jgi:hypothetical protein